MLPQAPIELAIIDEDGNYTCANFQVKYLERFIQDVQKKYDLDVLKMCSHCGGVNTLVDSDVCKECLNE